LLDEAAAVSPAEHDEWLRETAHESWIYDGPTRANKSAEFLATVRAEVYRPTYDKVFRSDLQAIYTIDGLPTVYLLYETTHVPGFVEPMVDLRHFVDLGSVVAPLSLRSCGGAAAFIE
jgi:hypothetical protein